MGAIVMRNKIKILSTKITSNCIEYNYEVSGEWKEAFNKDKSFFIEYSCDISEVPESIAVIPLLCNILPMAWIYDAEIYVPSCDSAFYNSIPEFKKGYEEMYPQMKFNGDIFVEKTENNSYNGDNGAVSFFSGGVDAFNTLVKHIDEKPLLLTVWGADVNLDDFNGWENVENHVKKTASEFNIDYVTVKSSFRIFQNESVLRSKVINISGDNWWHGFQHGIGIIGHSAPVCYAMNKSAVYFASSFTAADKGNYTCASDPTIDNYVKFGSSHVVHDGYEYDRQDKIHNIVNFRRKHKAKISLRVCWQSKGGKNCCECEKCWRTILGIVAEGEKASDYDMGYSDEQLKNFHRIYYNKNNIPDYRRDGVYTVIQNAMRKNLKAEQLPKELRWFYNINIKKLGYHPYRSFLGKLKNKVKRILKSVLGK